ncbi:hypothetical protein ACTMU2_36245 [Cupriavidus basilensis]
MHGLPVTIRTIDIGTDNRAGRPRRPFETALNPLRLRASAGVAVRAHGMFWQLRALLRASRSGRCRGCWCRCCRMRAGSTRRWICSSTGQAQLDERSVPHNRHEGRRHDRDSGGGAAAAAVPAAHGFPLDRHR